MISGSARAQPDSARVAETAKPNILVLGRRRRGLPTGASEDAYVREGGRLAALERWWLDTV
jgi:hypothetical protein